MYYMSFIYIYLFTDLSSEKHGLLTPDTSCDLQDKITKISLFLRDQQVQDLILFVKNVINI